MPLTPISFVVTAEEVQASTSGSYDLEPGYYDAKLVEIHNHKSKANNQGLRWVFSINGAEFNIYTMFTPKSQWKMNEVLSALGIDITGGYQLGDFDLELYIGTVVTAHVDFQKEDAFSAGVADGKRYREITGVYPKVDTANIESKLEDFQAASIVQTESLLNGDPELESF